MAIDGFPLRTLITTAFDPGFWQVSGGDEWVSKDIYFLEAIPTAIGCVFGGISESINPMGAF